MFNYVKICSFKNLVSRKNSMIRKLFFIFDVISFIYKNKFIQFTIFDTFSLWEMLRRTDSCSYLLDIRYSIFFRNSVAKQANLGIPVAVK